MSTAWLLPLEPFDSRYTGQWYKEFPLAFKRKYSSVKVIDGEPLSNTIDVGSWLPMNSTVHYKNTQVAKVAEAFQKGLVKDGDFFFSFDLEHWGIEAIKMMAQINKINVRIYAFLHAASYTREDLMEQLAPWQKYTEIGWLSICDKVFVGSEYHKQAVIERRIKPFADPADVQKLSDKIVVTGNPLFADAYHPIQTVKRNVVESGEQVMVGGEMVSENVQVTVESLKKNKIILPNRFDYEKRPNLSLDVAYIVKQRYPDWEFVVTTSNATLRSNQPWLVDKARGMEKDGIITIKEGLSKLQYHTEIAESKVMLTNSIEENFGYCIAESLYYDTMPVAPRGLSHTEMIPNELLFDSIEGAVEKIEMVMFGKKRFASGKNYLAKYFKAADVIVSETLTVKQQRGSEPVNWADLPTFKE